MRVKRLSASAGLGARMYSIRHGACSGSMSKSVVREAGNVKDVRRNRKEAADVALQRGLQTGEFCQSFFELRFECVDNLLPLLVTLVRGLQDSGQFLFAAL